MSKYGSFAYDQSTYGQKSRLAFSFNPFTSVALTYTSVRLTWSSPIGNYTAVKLLRNQDGYSETYEDGAVIFEEYGIDPLTGSIAISSFVDGVDNADNSNPPLVGGKFVYYRFWILRSSDNVWYPAGDSYALIPSDHPTFGLNKSSLMTTHDRFMNLLPRTYTSVSQSPLDSVNPDSDLYRFLQGMSFTVDEFLTMAESLLPDYSGSTTSPTIIAAKASQLGLTVEPTVSIKNQKRMLREAFYLYRNKGTLAALGTLVESLTGYAPVLTQSPNLMLSNADSTFYKGLGFWQNIGDCTLSVDDVTPITSESLTIDRMYSAKVVVNSATSPSIRNGEDYPITRGIPVIAGVDYALSYYIRTDTLGGATVTPSVTWYDYLGQVISSATTSSTINSVTPTWAKQTVALSTSPTGASYASLKFTFGATGNFNLDQIQFATANITDYHEARGITAYLSPKKVNYINNPSFEVSTAGWTTAGSQVSATSAPQVLVGTKALQLTAGQTATTPIATGLVPTSGYVTLSAFANSTNAADTATLGITAHTSSVVYGFFVSNNTAVLSVSSVGPVVVGNTVAVSGLGSPYDGTHIVTLVTPSQIGFIVSGSDVAETNADGTIEFSATSSTTLALGTDWSRLQFAWSIPAGFAQASTDFVVSLGGTFAGTALFDAVQFEPTFGATEYFDGDYGTERDAVWSGSSSTSPSYLYPNKITNVARLADEIVAFIPNDTPWMITSQSGIEASGITD
jgi:hypothetical protein